MTQRLKLALAGLLLALAVVGGLWAWKQSSRPVERHQLGLMTSLPIYWPEGAELSVVIEGSQMPWVRRELEERYDLVPLDTLSPNDNGGDGLASPLAGIRRLLIVQPRGLSPDDNVALDEWLRGGGHLLYVLDPMLSGQYAVPIGDPRHPAAIGLVPPVIGRWGLEVHFDENQPLSPREESYGEGDLPVLMAGKVQLRETDPADSEEDRATRGECRILGEGIAAQCKVGQGAVTLVADATLFEQYRPQGDGAEQLLELAEFALE